MKKIVIFSFLCVAALLIGRSADYLVYACSYVADHYIIVVSMVGIVLLIFLAYKYGPKLIKKYRERKDVYLNIDDDD